MTPEHIADLLTYLEQAKSRPRMYGAYDIDSAIAFLGGFTASIAVSCRWDQELQFAVLEQVLKARHWRMTGISPHHQMVEHGMTTEQILVELFEIEIEYIRRMEAAVSPHRR